MRVLYTRIDSMAVIHPDLTIFVPGSGEGAACSQVATVRIGVDAWGSEGYSPSMEIPLTVAILALVGLLGLVAWLLVRSERRNAHLVQQILEINTNYSDYTLKHAEKMTRDLPKHTDKMLDSLTRGIQDVMRGSSEAMQAIYGPVRQVEQQQSSDLGDLPTPWYTQEGALDTTDPTDGLLVADPVEYPEGPSNLIMDGDDEPFGVPGLKLDV